ncbi:MAG TPA: hypothetical protein VFM93_08540 [Candidatus Limnocylindria bacterium]|nr:hypothetical protein [Candidatus Limnocylindria bacterium]
MAVQSYLPETAGGTLVAAAFGDDDAARGAVDLLHGSGVRPQDISVIARERARAEHVAGDRAWTPWKNERRGGILAALPMPGRGLPKELRRRYGDALADRQIVVVAVAGGQPPDTLEALYTQAGGTRVEAWWTGPIGIFAPPEEAGPF